MCFNGDEMVVNNEYIRKYTTKNSLINDADLQVINETEQLFKQQT